MKIVKLGKFPKKEPQCKCKSCGCEYIIETKDDDFDILSAATEVIDGYLSRYYKREYVVHTNCPWCGKDVVSTFETID